jgi:hypothetical protein
VPPDWAFRWWVAHRHPRCPLPIFRDLTTTRPISASFLAKRKWPTSASPPSISSIGKTLVAACRWHADAVAAGAEAAVAAADAEAAAASEVAAVSGSLAAEVVAGAVAAVAAGLVASGSVPAWVAQPAAYPGERAACADARDLTDCSAARRRTPCPRGVKSAAFAVGRSLRSTSITGHLRCRPPLRKRARNGLMHRRNVCPQSITSSASICIEVGTSMPSFLAVFMLMTSSNLVERMTGRSAGFSPLRIRPARIPVWWYASPNLVP